MIVRLKLPLGELLVVDTLSVALVPAAGFGVKEYVALLGSPLIVNATDPVNAFSRVMAMP